jgi:hypothetical protein
MQYVYVNTQQNVVRQETDVLIRDCSPSRRGAGKSNGEVRQFQVKSRFNDPRYSGRCQREIINVSSPARSFMAFRISQ